MTQASAAETQAHPYNRLTPELLLDAVETYGVHCTGAFLALNSYENRVYRVDTIERGPVAAKFYRPGRWTDATILEEHAFVHDLAEQEIPAVAPLTCGGSTLGHHQGFSFALFPWQPGRASELNRGEERRVLGRYFGRLHRVGRAARFAHRPTLTVKDRGWDALALLLEQPFMPDYVRAAFRDVGELLLSEVEQAFAAVAPDALRVHGDAHASNILWTEVGPHLVDFDDCMTAPAVQDLWMFLSGSEAERQAQLDDLLAGYTDFADFNPAELRLIEPLRTLRLLHYNAWIARRWDDPAFPRAFPWFTSVRYWEDLLNMLREQQAVLYEPPLRMAGSTYY